VGLDASARYVTEARRRHGPELEFEVHDVTRTAFPVPTGHVLLCRFLLTHLRDPAAVLGAWASAAAPGARLLVHETESLESEHPTLRRYYALLSRLQAHYGQALDVGARLDAAFATSPWGVVDSRTLALELPASTMASLHLPNLRTWRNDEYARGHFEAAELDDLETRLARIEAGEEPRSVVLNRVRQIVAEAP
jgi:hypothetical protein